MHCGIYVLKIICTWKDTNVKLFYLVRGTHVGASHNCKKHLSIELQGLMPVRSKAHFIFVGG